MINMMLCQGGTMESMPTRMINREIREMKNKEGCAHIH